MIKLPYWIKVHTLLVKYKRIILNLFFISYILGFILIGAGFYLFNASPDIFWILNELGETFGSVALILFLGTLMPGILQRFGVFPLVTSSMVLFRRQIGILMFIAGMIHSSYVSTIPAFMTNNLSLNSLPVSSLYGLVGLSILMPVWLTSNDISVKKFGKFWKMIQRLSYFALLALFIHVALNTSKLAFAAFFVIVLEIVSWMKFWMSSRKKP